MIFSTLIERTRDRIRKRSQYNRLISEIEAMSQRDLADINGNRSEMLHQAYRQVYG